MKIAAIFTGEELLNGQTLNRNLLSLGQELNHSGLPLHCSLTCGDTHSAIGDALQSQLHQQSTHIIICGGLGPTADDLTRSAVAQLLGKKCFSDPELGQQLSDIMWLRKKKRPGIEWMKRQGETIEGCELLQNSAGYAPGLLLKEKDCSIYLLPGPPSEFNAVLREEVLPRLQQELAPKTERRCALVMETPETHVENALQGLLVKYPNLALAYCAQPEQVRLTFSVPSKEIYLLDLAMNEAKEIFKDNFVAAENISLAILQLLQEKKLCMATAESCTGGLIAASMTDLPGSSEIFSGAFITYSNEWKQRELGVSTDVLESFGAVSEQCCLAMLQGLKQHSGADCGIAVTGIAGPGGGSKDKPIGTVFIGTFLGDDFQFRRVQLSGMRNHIRQRTVLCSLNQLHKQLI